MLVWQRQPFWGGGWGGGGEGSGNSSMHKHYITDHIITNIFVLIFVIDGWGLPLVLVCAYGYFVWRQEADR